MIKSCFFILKPSITPFNWVGAYNSKINISLLLSKEKPQDSSVEHDALFSCSGCTMMRFDFLNQGSDNRFAKAFTEAAGVTY